MYTKHIDYMYMSDKLQTALSIRSIWCVYAKVMGLSKDSVGGPVPISKSNKVVEVKQVIAFAVKRLFILPNK